MKIITKNKFAPARVPNVQRLKQVMNARIHIASGSKAEDGKVPLDKQLCIMEATAYTLGYKFIDDSPPCTSAKIRDFMITINDSRLVSDRQRAKLKHVIPFIVNTAPTSIQPVGWLWDGHNNIPDYELITIEEDPDYIKAEDEREVMIDKFKWRMFNQKEGDYKLTVPMREILAFIRKLADIAHFDGTAKIINEK